MSILLGVLLFVFASYGVQRYGGQLYQCNDPLYKKQRDNCTGTFFREVRVTDMNLASGRAKVGFKVPRVWYVVYTCI